MPPEPPREGTPQEGTPRDAPDGEQLRVMLSTMVSVAERLAVLAQSTRSDELTELANRLDNHPQALEGNVREEVWANTVKEDKLLARISRSMDQGDIQSAAGGTLKLSTHALHRHSKAREQFFTVGRGAGGGTDYTEAEQWCLDVEKALDAVIPEAPSRPQPWRWAIPRPLAHARTGWRALLVTSAVL